MALFLQNPNFTVRFFLLLLKLDAHGYTMSNAQVLTVLYPISCHKNSIQLARWSYPALHTYA